MQTQEQQAIIEFLKKNLSVHIDVERRGVFFDDLTIEVKLSVDGQEISKSSQTIRIT